MGTINICYIKGIDYIDEIISPKKQKIPYLAKWLIYMYKKIFKVFTIKQINEKNIIIIPCRVGDKKINKWIKNLNNILYDKNIDTIVLSNSLKGTEGIKESLNKENINILDGKFLKENMMMEIIKYISNEINKNMKELEISLLINDNKTQYMKSIINLAGNVKNIKIVTNNTQKFKMLAQKLQDLFRDINQNN